MQSTGIQNYLNTLIFCIVAKAVTIILLALLFTRIGSELAYLLLTIELGMILIIVVSLYKIYDYEKKKKDALEKLLKTDMNLNSCPDYYTRTITTQEGIDQTTCVNKYNSPDGSTSYRFGTSDNEFNLENTFNANKDKKTFRDYCARVSSTTATPNFNNIAWTDLKEKCKSSTYM